MLRATLWQVWSSQTNAVRVSLRLFDELPSPDQTSLFKGVVMVCKMVASRWIQSIACWLARGIALKTVAELIVSSCTTTLIGPVGGKSIVMYYND